MAEQTCWRDDDLIPHLEDEIRGGAFQMTSTSMLKAKIRNLYANTPEQMDAASRQRLADYKTQLLCRGYVTSRGPRGGIRFTYVGHVPEDAPAWGMVNQE
jgi:hypothetical protein